jgi:protein-tyrosine phosphatase
MDTSSKSSLPALRPNLLSEPLTIVFVCLGNICRSPLAEASFLQVLAQKSSDQQAVTNTDTRPNVRVQVFSGATSHWEVGKPADPRSIKAVLAYAQRGHGERRDEREHEEGRNEGEHDNSGNNNSALVKSILAHCARRLDQLPLKPNGNCMFICMDRDNLQDSQSFIKRHARRSARWSAHLFSDFGSAAGEEVDDPYYGDFAGFERTLQLCLLYSHQLHSYIFE